MKKQKIILFLLTIILLIGNTHRVRADVNECQGELENYNTRIAYEEEFVYNIGTMGVASNAYINEINYVIEYDQDDLEVVNLNGKAASAYNGWTVEVEHDTNTGLRVNRITIRAFTNDKSRMYTNIISDEFVKIAYIKFKVKTKSQKSTSIELMKEISSYNYAYDDSDNNDKTECYNSSVTVVNIYNKDSNASLSSLKVDNGEISPKFNESTTTYNVTVDNEVNTIQIDGTCSGTNCKLSGTGLKKIAVGENKFTITVTSEKGTTKKYTLNVNRREKEEVYLQKLIIKDIDLYPVFNSEISHYIVNVPNETTELKIEYASNDDTVNTVDIIGNENLKVGKNYITITVRNEKSKIEKSYEIMVIKEEPIIVEEKTNNINISLIIAVILGIVSVVELVIIINKSKK